MTEIAIPELCLVALIGVSGAGKTTFAARHFGAFEVISSDYCRGLVADDENDQSASADAFEVLGHIAGTRLRRGRLTVVDATSVTKASRSQLITLAREHDVLPVAIVLDVHEATATERNRHRPERDFGDHVIRRQSKALRSSLRGLQREGFRVVHVLRPDQVESATIVRERLRNDFTDRLGPFDIVGDVHGCLSELVQLLQQLGWQLVRDDQGRPVDAVHPDGRTLVLVGDLVDRGPDSPGVLRLAMGMTSAGHALAAPGNHEAKLIRALDGRKVQTGHGLQQTLDQLDAETPEFRRHVRDWCYSLVSHLVLDDGKLVIAHAGLKEAYHGRASGRVRSFALYGDTTGETDEFGLPVRYPWATEYRGRAAVVYGHTPTPELEWINNTLCLDTGCVFGGHLSALRYPERETVRVPAEQVWCEPVRPLHAPPTRRADELRLADVTGLRRIETQLAGLLTINEANAAGALEVMSRFALHPGWLPYLPPTMSPVATSRREGTLEHPAEAFSAYAEWGVERVICEEKHMGSRCVALVCADEQTARRFGPSGSGALYTRTGRSFFGPEQTDALLAELTAACREAGLFAELNSSWLLFDTELLPWSAKAEALIKEQYASVGAAALTTLPVERDALAQAAARGLDVGALARRTAEALYDARGFVDAYRRYQWDVEGLDGVQIAPFQLLASNGATYEERDHEWHLALAARLAQAAPQRVRLTRHLVVDTSDEQSLQAGVDWWEDLTSAGGEGMVVKPWANLVRHQGRAVQPGLKVRGREYLRIIYGPGYLRPDRLDRLRERNLGRKRSLAQREYALGIEGLHRLVAGEPLWRVHEAVFGVLALETEPVDPRL